MNVIRWRKFHVFTHVVPFFLQNMLEATKFLLGLATLFESFLMMSQFDERLVHITRSEIRDLLQVSTNEKIHKTWFNEKLKLQRTIGIRCCEKIHVRYLQKKFTF